MDVFSPRVRLSRPPSASTPRSSASAHGLPSPGEHRDLRTVPGSWATGESRGLSTRISREGCSSGRSDRSPLPPPAPAGSVRCWRRAGLPRAVVRVCKEKCAIPDLEESVALNSLVPYDMKHTIRVCRKNASKRYPALCVQNKITIHRREETCIPSNRGIQRQAPTTIALPLSCSLRSLPHNGGLQGRFGEGGGKGRGRWGRNRPLDTLGTDFADMTFLFSSGE